MNLVGQSLVLRNHPRSCLAVLFGLASTLASAATIVVNDASDSLHSPGCAINGHGTCSLRDAITFANSNPGADQIKFNIPGAGVHTISPTSALPSLTDNAGVTIDGYTQPGASPNTLVTGDDAALLIEVDGSSIPSGTDGMLFLSSNNTIRGLVLNRYLVAYCISIFGSNNLVEGNFLGTDPTGLVAKPCRGAFSTVGESGNVIGGVNPASRNLMVAVSLNVVDLDGLGLNTFQGNYVGTDRNGTKGLGSPFFGVAIGSGDHNLIGGSTPGAGNLISGNGGSFFDGVLVGTSDNSIAGNLIGTDATGTKPLPNAEYGVFVLENAFNNAIFGNLIAFNGHAGIKIGHFNDSVTNGNRISANQIRLNGGLGIDLGTDGATANDHCDSDTGPNNLQNFPVLLTAIPGPGTTRITGTLDSVANASYTIEFFSNTTCDSSGYGQGDVFLGSTTVVTDPFCSGAFDVTLPVTLRPTDQVTATATDSAGNTSEFSACIPIETATAFHTVTPCRVADTRNPVGPYGGPALGTLSDRSFVITGQCGISPTALSGAFNFTVTQPTNSGNLVVYSGGTALPNTSTISYSVNQTRANNAIVPFGAAGDILVHVSQASGTVQFIIDVVGYFE